MNTTNHRDAAEFLTAIEFLRGHVGCTGPLGHLRTSDPTVRVLCNAIRHLLARRRQCDNPIREFAHALDAVPKVADAPFSLTSPVSKSTRERQVPLFLEVHNGR
jgi:hypothetical protein